MQHLGPCLHAVTLSKAPGMQVDRRMHRDRAVIMLIALPSLESVSSGIWWQVELRSFRRGSRCGRPLCSMHYL
jgi:hypothetical protein